MKNFIPIAMLLLVLVCGIGCAPEAGDIAQDDVHTIDHQYTDAATAAHVGTKAPIRWGHEVAPYMVAAKNTNAVLQGCCFRQASNYRYVLQKIVANKKPDKYNKCCYNS